MPFCFQAGGKTGEGGAPSSGDLLELDSQEGSSEDESGALERVRASAEWTTLLSPDTPGTQGNKGVGVRGFLYNNKGEEIVVDLVDDTIVGII